MAKKFVFSNGASIKEYEWLKVSLLVYVDILRRNEKLEKCIFMREKSGSNGFCELDMVIRMRDDRFAVIQTVQGLLLTQLLNSIIQYCTTYFHAWAGREEAYNNLSLFFSHYVNSLYATTLILTGMTVER